VDVGKIVKAAAGTKEKPASPWGTLVMVVIVVITVALSAIPAILARRKAARLAHERDLLLEERERSRMNEISTLRDSDIAGARQRQAEATVALEEVEAELASAQKTRDSFAASLQEITSWDQLSL
jgi:hypothetical protein